MFQSSKTSKHLNAVNFKLPPKNIVITDNLLVDKRAERQKIEKEIASNKKDQQYLDNDVILSGFSLMTDLNSVTEKLCKIFSLPSNFVKSCYHFETKRKEAKVFHVVITCKDKSTQIQVLKEAKQTEIRMNSLISLKGEKFNPVITCNRRLSKFNNSTVKQLRKLKEKEIIAEVKFEGLFHHFKPNQTSSWKEVSHNAVLDPFNDILNKTDFLSKKT